MSDIDDGGDVRQAVRRYVRSGFYDAERVAEMVGEEFEVDDGDAAALRAVIDAAFATKRAEERSWPAETDCDRLDRAFASLAAARIIALQNAGYTQSDGWEEVVDAYRAAGGRKSHSDGYCFYHGQDLDRAVEDGELYLAFGDIASGGSDTAKGAEVGRRIKQALEAAGLTVKWDGTMKTRLLVTGMNWQRRGPAR